MTNSAPLHYRWRKPTCPHCGAEASDHVMIPIDRYRLTADRQFSDTELYRLVEENDASMASRGHYFARLTELHDNLPEDLADRFPQVEDLRAWALIKTGHAKTRSQVFQTPEDAERGAAIIALYTPRSVIIVQGREVLVATALSQSTRAMKKEQFEQSKNDVLAYVEAMVGVKADQKGGAI